MPKKDEVKPVVEESVGVKPVTTESPTVEPVTIVEPSTEDDLDKPVIPRRRLNEEIDKRKAAEEKVQSAEAQMATIQAQIASQQEIEKENTETIQARVNEYVTELGWSEDFAKKFIKNQQEDIQKASRTPAVLSKFVLDDAIGKKPDAKKYRAEIERKINMLRNPEARTDPDTVRQFVDLVLGEHDEERLKEAEERGFTRSETQRKIVTGLGTEGVSSSVTSKQKPLSDAEKKIAVNMGLTEKQYQEGKEKLTKK